MKLLGPSFSVVDGISYKQMLEIIEGAYRVCYASEPKGDAEEFIKSKIKLGHLSPLEHVSVSVDFTFDRGVSHEICRHRVGVAFSQQSTRYCNFGKEKFGEEISVITPFFFNPIEPTQQVNVPIPVFDINISGFFKLEECCVLHLNKFDVWFISCLYSEWSYMLLLDMGASPQEARSVLPNSLATKMRITANIREWIHIFNLRVLGTTGRPHPQMKEAMLPVMEYFKENYPVFFADLGG